MKKIIYILLCVLMVESCKPSSNSSSPNNGMVNFVKSVICKSYVFSGDSLIGKSEPTVFSFEYNQEGMLDSYCKDSDNPIKWNNKQSKWEYDGKGILSEKKKWINDYSADGQMLYDLWCDIVNMPIAIEGGHIDSLSAVYSDYWARNTNIDFSNPSGWICSGGEHDITLFRVETIIEYYPSSIVLDTFGYALGNKDLPVFITQKRVLPNNYFEIKTYRIQYKNSPQKDSYYDTVQYRVPYLNNCLPGQYPVEDNPEECEI